MVNNLSEMGNVPVPHSNIFVTSIFMISSFVTCLYFLHEKSYLRTLIEVFSFVFATMIILVGLEFIRRLYYFFDELTKKMYGNEGHLSEAFFVNFSFGAILSFLCTFCLIASYFFYTGQISLCFCTFSNSRLSIHEKKIAPLVIAFLSALIFSYLLLDLLNIGECKPQKLQVFNQLLGLDYGSSMACNYFYGYLKIILPSDGKENHGLLGRIAVFEADQDVEIPVKKFFILIPASFYIPPNLKDSSKGWLEAVPEKLQFVKVDRAGVAQRTYKNTVYKIHPGGFGSGKSPVYVVTEGATPLLSFLEVQQHKHTFSDIYTEYKREIGISFSRTLQQLLNDNPDCRDVCELLYYEDFDRNGKSVNPAEILLQRIKEESRH